jgi:hypothetical protein
MWRNAPSTGPPNEREEPTARFLSGGHSTMETVLAWIERNRISRESSGPMRSFGVSWVATGNLVGMVEAKMN